MSNLIEKILAELNDAIENSFPEDDWGEGHAAGLQSALDLIKDILKRNQSSPVRPRPDTSVNI